LPVTGEIMNQGATEQPTRAEPERWLAEHGDALFAFALARIGKPADAEDLVQETLCAGIRGRDKFEGKSQVRSWLIGILKRKIVDLLRQRARDESGKRQLAADDLFAQQFSAQGHWSQRQRRWTDSLPETEEFWQILHGCVSRLPPNFVAVFVMRELDEEAPKEICNKLDITPSNLAVRLHRARVLLRKCLEERWFS